MALRGVPIGGDDLSYALVLWKYLAIYGLVRTTVRTDAQIHRCLQISMAVGIIVGCGRFQRRQSSRDKEQCEFGIILPDCTGEAIPLVPQGGQSVARILRGVL